MTADIMIVSFGFRHGGQPDADVTLDVRRILRDPHVDPAMRELTGFDRKVRDHVIATPGALNLVRNLVDVALDLAVLGDAVIAFGCAGGRHRSVVLAELLGECIAGNGVAYRVVHRDIDKPVLASLRESGA